MTKSKSGRDTTGRKRRARDDDLDSVEVTMESFKIPKKLKTSDILLEKDWPEGYSKEAIDSMSVEAVNSIKDRELKTKKVEKDDLPGVRVARQSITLKTTKVKAGPDNSSDILNYSARFLRPPTSDPSVWWSKVPTSWDPKLPEFGQAWLGTSCQIPKKTFLLAADRGVALQAKHYSEKNYHVDKKSSKAMARFGEGGMEVEGFRQEYFDPTNIHEMIMAIQNLAAVYFQLWPWDYTPLVMMRVALRLLCRKPFSCGLPPAPQSSHSHP